MCWRGAVVWVSTATGRLTKAVPFSRRGFTSSRCEYGDSASKEWLLAELLISQSQPVLNLLDYFTGSDFQSLGKLEDRLERRVLLTSLQLANVGAMITTLKAKLLLR